MGFLKMNRRDQFQTQFLFAALVLLVVSCQSFKLPVSFRKNIEPWQRTQLHSESDDVHDVSSDINSISSSPGKPIKFPDGSEIADFDAKIRQEDNDSSPYFPVVVFNRNGFSNSKYIGEARAPEEHGTGSEPRLQRFYKHFAKSPRRNAEMIVFPGEDNQDSGNKKDSEEFLKFSSGTADDGASSETETERPTEPPIISNESQGLTSSNKTPHDEASKHSLESLAQIVRHILFRGAGPVSGEVTTTEPVQQNNETENSKSDVSEQSLYTGPKVKLNSDSDGCSDGLKKTRNGSCQKPSRRLGTG